MLWKDTLRSVTNCRRFTLNIELGFVKPVELQVEAEADSFKSDQRNQVDHWYGAWMKWKNGCLNDTAHSEEQ